MNLPLISSLLAILVAQVIKYPIAWLFNRKSAKLSIITATGGMPSSHSAAVCSLITALLFEYGIESPHVAIATVFGVIVMYDAMGIRRQSGEQGLVLDKIARHYHKNIDETEECTIEDKVTENPVTLQYDTSNYDQAVIKKYMGHTPLEVFFGALTGIIVACLVQFIYHNYF